MDRIKFKKNIKIILFCVIVMLPAIIANTISSMLASWMEIWPWSQRDTEWVSVDCFPVIEINVKDFNGTIILDNEEIPIDIFHDFEFVQLYTYDSDKNVTEVLVEFNCWYYAEDEFSAKVIQSNVPYFEKGQKITFRSVD